MKSFFNTTPLSFDELFELEKNIYDDQIIPKDTTHIPIINTKHRYKEIFLDKSFNKPENIFFIKYKKNIFFGRKIRSILNINNKIKAINCSRINASMLLGFLSSYSLENENIFIEYFPLEHGEKLAIFDEIKKDRLLNIDYPFRYYDFYTKKEKSCPKTGWSLNPEKVLYLGFGEKHIRDYTLAYLKQFMKGNEILYDPACSTGEFLFTLKKEFPTCKTIGQDLSEEMVNYARDYIDEVYYGDAINSPLIDLTVDMMFLRFLNAEVVDTMTAYSLFDKLLKKVKKGGLIFCFGHTPVLIKEKYFYHKKLSILQKNGYNKESDSIFQYYILRK